MVKKMRVVDPVGGAPDLDLFFRNYEEHFRNLKSYPQHLRRLIAGYSRGDSADELRPAFSMVVEKVAAMQKKATSKDGGAALVFAHHGEYPEVFRDALVLLSFGLCLRASEGEISAILASCERGDPLIELLAAAAAPKLKQAVTGPAFYQEFDGLYDAVAESGTNRESSIAEYLKVWYIHRMEGFVFKDMHLEPDPSAYIGYWCFEAAGVVAALGIDDARFSSHPHYPKDLVAAYRM